MKDHVSTDDHRRTLAWLDDSLEWARPRDRTRVTKLLDLVRSEIVFDMTFSESPPSIRNGSAAVGLNFDESHRV